MIYDQLRDFFITSKINHTEDALQWLKDSVHLKSQNVVDYVLSQGGVCNFTSDHLPNVAPPWKNFSVTFKLNNNQFFKLGFDQKLFNMASGIDVISTCFSRYDKEIFTLYMGHFFGDNKNLFCLGKSTINISSDGGIPKDNGNIITSSLNQSLVKQGEVLVIEKAKDLLSVCDYIVLMSCCFANCKNVEKKENFLDKKIVRNRIRNNKFPINKYYTLEIFPHNISRKQCQESNGEHWHNRFHICRGHFRRYTSEAPLFGRVVGTFWVPMHVKGSKEEGEVIKEYAVGGKNG